jgi:glucokinase
MNRGAETAVVAAEVEARQRPVTQPLDWSGVLAQHGYVFGVDISAEGERIVLADLRGTVLGRTAHVSSESPNPSMAPPDEVIARASALMRDLLEKKGLKVREVLRIGMGFGGPVDSRLGLVRTAHGARGWEGFPLAAKMESEFDATTLLENDARLAALGEMWFGVGAGGQWGVGSEQGSSSGTPQPAHRTLPPIGDLVYVHWSTGVGGGIVSDGRLLRGATTIAGEVGHTVVRTGDNALPCRCGGRGHLEAYVRAPALLQRAQDLWNSELGMRNADSFGKSDSAFLIPNSEFSIATLFAHAEHDSTLQRLVDEAVEMMAVTVGNLITSMNPRVAVIGGRVAREGAHLIPRIASLARSYAMPVSAHDVTIAPAALGDEATVMGAVALALDSLR